MTSRTQKKNDLGGPRPDQIARFVHSLYEWQVLGPPTASLAGVDYDDDGPLYDGHLAACTRHQQQYDRHGVSVSRPPGA